MSPTAKEVAQIEFLRKRGYRVSRFRRQDRRAWMYRVEKPSFHNLPHSAE